MAALSGRVALVTGGGRGIGRGIALGLSKYGAKVAVTARTTEEIEQVAHEIRARGGEAIAVTADIADYADVRRVIATVAQELGTIDILVNNAAVAEPVGETANTDPEAWVSTQLINVAGPYYAIRETLPDMKKQGYGRIVNISTGAAFGQGMVPASAYSVSKAALEMLTMNIAAEVKDTGIAITSVRPGVVDTAMQTNSRQFPVEKVGEAFQAMFKQFYEEGMLTDPLDVGLQVVAVILSEKSGEQINVLEEADELAAILAQAEPVY
jgi:NAD(P)-dependent dehydrogenase (short-subunit alcohol dehydrogenase family)